MKKWIRKFGALALVLALLLVFAGCAADVGIIGGEDGPTKIISGTQSDRSEDIGGSVGSLPEKSESDSASSKEDDPIEAVTSSSNDADNEEEQPPEGAAAIDEDGTYSSAEEVALYLHTFGHLPKNYITKNEARDLGWTGGSVEKYAPGCAIGGDTFGNREGLLPAGKYHECDIDTVGKNSRGAKRLIYADDGRIYYTEDHYESFILLYGEE